MACREPGSIVSVLRSTARGALALALVAAPVAAGAAKLSQVRVGTHESHTRIVLELDEAASYRLAPPAEGGTQLEIQLDADSAARHVSSKSPLVKAVRVEPSQRGSTIAVDLARAGVEVSEMVLADPPRIVLDLKPVGSAAKAAVLSTAPPAALARPTAPAPAPKPAAEPAPGGRLAADGRPVPETGAAPSLSDPVPSDIAAKPAERFEAPPAPPAAAPAPPPAETPSAKAAPPVDRPSANPEIATKAAGEAALAAKPSGAKPAAAAEEVAPSAPGAPAAPEVAPRPATRPAEVVVRKPAPPKPVPAATSWVDRLTSPAGYAAIGVALLLAVVLAVRRRRSDQDDDPLYSVMAAGDAGGDQDDLRGQQLGNPVVEWGRHDDEPADEAEYSPVGFDADEPVSRDGSQQLCLGQVRPIEAEPPAPEPDPDAMFDGPGAPAIATPPAPAVAAPDGAYAGDAAAIAGALEDRVKDLERRIEQLAEARERLERQVAAQTEELRVQRAAIARTQRVVRSMTKGDDLATEPVPRPS